MKKERITMREDGQYVIKQEAQYSLHDLVQLAGKYENLETVTGKISAMLAVLIMTIVFLLLIAGIKALVVMIF